MVFLLDNGVEAHQIGLKDLQPALKFLQLMLEFAFYIGGLPGDAKDMDIFLRRLPVLLDCAAPCAKDRVAVSGAILLSPICESARRGVIPRSPRSGRLEGLTGRGHASGPSLETRRKDAALQDEVRIRSHSKSKYEDQFHADRRGTTMKRIEPNWAPERDGQPACWR